ncbi:MAG: M18 family aminopeptidase [Eubacteriales bacterium]
MRDLKIKDFMQFINESTSPFHAVMEVKKRLDNVGFIELKSDKDWDVRRGNRYYLSPYPSSLFVFDIPKEINLNNGFRIISAHTDQPCFRIKPSTEMREEGYLKINTEVYGGPILNTWLDRPLSIAGKVALRNEDVMNPKIEFIDIKKPIMIIPNLAIHMNKEVNKGFELNRQRDMIPLAGILNNQLNKEDYFLDFLAEHLKVNIEDILDFDLFVYLAEKGEVIGLYDDFISAPRLDDLAMVYASINAIIETKATSAINIVALFDNEEIGSRTKQGADSELFSMILERLTMELDIDKTQYYQSLTKSFMISADMAHALHPNHPEKHDPTNQPMIGKGIVLKISGNQRYSTDSEAIAVFQQICEKGEIPYQKYVNRSDEVGGKTLGPLATAYVPVRSVDVGNPMLAMHSSRELMGVEDHYHTIEALKMFFAL